MSTSNPDTKGTKNPAMAANVNRQIKGEIYDALRTALVKPQGKSKKSWTDGFIQSSGATMTVNQ